MALRVSENRLRLATRAGSIGIWDWDIVNNDLFWDDSMYSLYGIRKEDFCGAYDAWTRTLHPADRQLAEGEIQAAIRGERQYAPEFRIVRPDGMVRVIQATSQTIRDGNGKACRMLGTNVDITERKRAEKALQEREFFFRESQRAASIGSYKVDFTVGQWAPSAVLNDIFGIDDKYSRSVQGWLDIVHPDDRDMMNQYLQEEVLSKGKPFAKEYRIIRRNDGAMRWVNGLGKVTFDDRGAPLQMFGTIQDITERKEAEAIIAASLKEKETLLKEIHHRVKNNLQIISSLLRMQSRQIDNAMAKAALQDMQSRIRTMALIHENLYRSENLAQVDLAAYLKSLCQQLFRALVVDPGIIRLKMDMSAVLVGIDQALPCGLLVNELVSNAIKHAFPKGHTGELRVELLAAEGGHEWLLRVSDNGVGLPADLDLSRLKSLGLSIIPDLAKQIGGKLEIAPPPGATFTVTFTPVIG